MKKPNLAALAALVALIFALVPSLPGLAQPLEPRKMADFDLASLRELSLKSYIVAGPNLVTGRLIFQGLKAEPMDPGLLLSMADFYFELQPSLAAVIYWRLLSGIDGYDEDLHARFMTSFCDAMYQFGLATRPDGKKDLSLADFADYGAWTFDFDTLGNHAKGAAAEFGSVDNFVLVLETALGMQVGFVEKKPAESYEDYMPANVRLSPEWDAWLASFPEEVKSLLAGE
jgi:hypothetical protein